jgi:uncharacterized protein YbjT (DUF2867 family)
MKVALVIGATGAVGRELLWLLLREEEFAQVHVFVRTFTGVNHKRLVERLVDFDRPELWQDELKGEVLFSCMGTTLSAAGSKAAQYKVDYTFQFTSAKAAALNGVKRYVLVSSAGSAPSSPFFYTRIKGELEYAVTTLSFDAISIIKPSFIDAERKETRKGEKIGIRIMRKLVSYGLFKSYEPVTAREVAKAMIMAYRRQGNRRIVEYRLNKIIDLATY